MEEWRDVPGYEGIYQVSISSKEGSCRSLKFGRTTVLSSKPNKTNKRICWALCKDGKVVHHQAAWWIAITFPELVGGEWFPGAQIDHIDTDRLNNHPSNLRWVTQKENLNNPLTRKNISKVQRNRPDTSKPVVQYDLDGNFIRQYPSINEAGRETGLAPINILNCCNGKASIAGNKNGKYVWRFVTYSS